MKNEAEILDNFAKAFDILGDQISTLTMALEGIARVSNDVKVHELIRNALAFNAARAIDLEEVRKRGEALTA